MVVTEPTPSSLWEASESQRGVATRPQEAMETSASTPVRMMADSSSAGTTMVDVSSKASSSTAVPDPASTRPHGQPVLPLPLAPTSSSSFKVPLHLDDPIWGTHDSSDISQAVLAACTPLESYLRAEMSSFEQREATTRLDHANDMLAFAQNELKRACGDPSASFSKYMSASNLSGLCPRIDAWCVDDLITHQKGDLDHYFSSLLHANSIMQLCFRIEDDVMHDRYKHTAHTVALLYQAIAHARRPLEKYKLAIEQKFTKLKAVTHGIEEGKYEAMPPKIKAWLLDVLESIRDALMSEFESLVPAATTITSWLQVAEESSSGRASV